MITVGSIIDNRLSIGFDDTVSILTPGDLAQLLTEMIVKCDYLYPIQKTLTGVIEDDNKTVFDFKNERLVFTRNLTVRHERTLDNYIRLTQGDIIIIVRTLNNMFNRFRPFDWNEVKLNVTLEGGDTKCI